MRRAAWMFIAVALCWLSGCGPIVSGVQIIRADIELSAAKSADAPKHALYEYTAASEYLKKAREENAYSDFYKSRLYADKALHYAEKARQRAEAAAQAEQPVVLPEER